MFAFAAGPFPQGYGRRTPGLYVRQSKLKSAEDEAPEVLQITAQGMKSLANFFAQPFPFPKYDQVLIPGFAYGGMEHAGATFLREESVLFRTVPTHSDKLERDILLLHELTHQWFGDLVTMRWFDDLWLKEGFAEYMAYQHAGRARAARRISGSASTNRIKPAAYAIDCHQRHHAHLSGSRNLADAKSAYGAIVYAKAPGLLRQLAFMLGEHGFSRRPAPVSQGARLRQRRMGRPDWLAGACIRQQAGRLGQRLDSPPRHAAGGNGLGL